MRKGDWAVAVVAMLAVLPLRAADTANPSLTLAPLAEEALRACKARDLEKALSDRLGRSKRFRFVAGEEATELVLEVSECSMLQQRRTVFETGGRPVRMPTGRGRAEGAESETGLRLEAQGLVVLRARVRSGSRFVEVSAAPKDRNLSEAAESLKRAIDRLLAQRGQWLLGVDGREES